MRTRLLPTVLAVLAVTVAACSSPDPTRHGAAADDSTRPPAVTETAPGRTVTVGDEAADEAVADGAGCRVPPTPEEVDAPAGARDYIYRFERDEVDVVTQRDELEILTSPDVYRGRDVPLDVTSNDEVVTAGTPTVIAATQPQVGAVLLCDGQLTYRLDAAAAAVADAYLHRDQPGTATALLPDDVPVATADRVRYCVTVELPQSEQPVACTKADIEVFDPVQSALLSTARAQDPDVIAPALWANTLRDAALENGATGADLVHADRAMTLLWSRYLASNPIEQGRTRVLAAWACGGPANAGAEGMQQGLEWLHQATDDLSLLGAHMAVVNGKSADSLPPLDELDASIDAAASNQLLSTATAGGASSGLQLLMGVAAGDAAVDLSGVATAATALYEARLRDQHPDWTDERVARESAAMGDQATVAAVVTELAANGTVDTLDAAGRQLLTAVCTTLLSNTADSR